MKHNLVYLIDGMGMGGAEKLLTQIVSHLDRDTFLPRVCVLQKRGESELSAILQQHDIAVNILNIHQLGQWNALPRVIACLRSSDCDLLHTQLQHADILGGVAAKLLKIPCLSTIHTLISRESSLKKLLKQRLEWFVHRRCCSRILTVSEASRRNYLSCNTSCSPEQVTTLHNGIALDCFCGHDFSRQTALRASLGIAPTRKVIMSVAVLRREKGIQYALEALPQIIVKHPEVLYLIVGDGPYRETLREQTIKRGLHDHVLFTGQRQNIPEMLACSDIFLLPTLTEALPTVVAEAMAAEKPVVASAVGGVPEMITDCENGILIPPASPEDIAAACLTLLADPEKAGHMGVAGGKNVHKHFNIGLQVRKLADIYMETIDNYARKR